MSLTHDQITRFLRSVHPYDSLSDEALQELGASFQVQILETDAQIYRLGQKLDGLYLIYSGTVEVTDENGAVVSHLGLRNSFGERGLLRDGVAVTSARCESDTTLLMLPVSAFQKVRTTEGAVQRFFDRAGPVGRKAPNSDLASTEVATIMARTPITLAPEDTVKAAAQKMHAAGISSLCITEGDGLLGIITTGDLVGKVLAEERTPETALAEIMTRAPRTLPSTAIGSDVLHMMMEHGIGHIPIVDKDKLVGIVTQTDLTRFQAVTSAEMVREIAKADSAEEMAKVTARIPQLLAQLVGAGHRHDIVTRLITDVADTATRRLLALAEDTLGAPPVPYVWLACGSQGRQEQTGVSDQDTCLILDDAATEEMRTGYFAELAQFVCDGLNTCGYVYCPGDMMATADRWRQPLRVWREYFVGWITTPNPEAQMLASVMFDLRPIGGKLDCFARLQNETLAAASHNSIFVAHMVGNALKHHPPLGVLRGLATIRSGEHKNQIDMKHNGVVPVVDLGRLCALQGRLTPANTRARLRAASDGTAGISSAGAADLLNAYDLIAEMRLDHQLRQIHEGQPPDNYLSPADLSDFERSHLRDAFVVVKSLQSAIGHGRSALS
jgi:CBS domain-containing protein